MKETMTIPQPATLFIDSVNNQNPKNLHSVFAPDAVVHDAGREIRGSEAIQEWAENEIFAVNVSLEILDAVEHDGETLVTVKVDGTFDRTGLPDPLLMDQCFTIVGDKIVSLTCRLAEEKPSH
ncbi:MAG: nuclear transport factor 2 family protein [Candidatus Omnitrophica bacterium]|nr:nuclear transport factor 2 family protein [Candidatus Omnitrophota bacterium]